MGRLVARAGAAGPVRRVRRPADPGPDGELHRLPRLGRPAGQGGVAAGLDRQSGRRRPDPALPGRRRHPAGAGHQPGRRLHARADHPAGRPGTGLRRHPERRAQHRPRPGPRARRGHRRGGLRHHRGRPSDRAGRHRRRGRRLPQHRAAARRSHRRRADPRRAAPGAGRAGRDDGPRVRRPGRHPARGRPRAALRQPVRVAELPRRRHVHRPGDRARHRRRDRGRRHPLPADLGRHPGPGAADPAGVPARRGPGGRRRGAAGPAAHGPDRPGRRRAGRPGPLARAGAAARSRGGDPRPDDRRDAGGAGGADPGRGGADPRRHHAELRRARRPGQRGRSRPALARRTTGDRHRPGAATRPRHGGRAVRGPAGRGRLPAARPGPAGRPPAGDDRRRRAAAGADQPRRTVRGGRRALAGRLRAGHAGPPRPSRVRHLHLGLDRPAQGRGHAVPGADEHAAQPPGGDLRPGDRGGRWADPDHRAHRLVLLRHVVGGAALAGRGPPCARGRRGAAPRRPGPGRLLRTPPGGRGQPDPDLRPGAAGRGSARRRPPAEPGPARR